MAHQASLFSVILLLGLAAPSLGIHALPVATPHRKQEPEQQRQRQQRQQRQQQRRRQQQHHPRINRTTNSSAPPRNSSRTGSRLNAMSRAWATPSLDCGADTPGVEYAVGGDQAPGPGILCSTSGDECAVLIGDECCSPDNGDTFYWCEVEPMCSATTPGATLHEYGLTPSTKGIYCRTTGDYRTCFESEAYRQQNVAGYFCPHSYFWAKNVFVECTDLLPNPAYNGLRFAKAACINAGDECFGVLDTNCDGYEDTRLCSRATTRSRFVQHPQSCVHEKIYRTPASYHALCTEQGDGAERVEEGHTFEEEGVFCEDGPPIKCNYVQQNDVASKDGSYCWDTKYAVGPTATYTTTTGNS